MVASNGQLVKGKLQKYPPKPAFLKVIPENIPEELKAIPNWMCWAYELRQKKHGEWNVARGQKLSHFRGQIEPPGSLSRGATVV